MSDLTCGDLLTDRIPLQAGRARLLAAAEVGLIFAVFFIHAAWRVPEVNEAHYLSKAKHYWNPDWCPHDFFCNTADAHHVFYWTFGWLSLWLPLPAMAWCGRLIAWALLAWSWRRLSVALVPLPLFAVLSAALFVALNSRCHMAGEWVVGGIEAKAFAYALVFLGLEALVKNRWSLVWPWLGASAAFHVLIGGWSLVSAGLAWLVLKVDKPPLARMAGPLALGFVLSLVGLLPALTLNRGVDAQIIDRANVIQVFERLPHHLLPERFAPLFLARFALLFGFWLALCFIVAAGPRSRRLRAFVAGTLAIAAAGVAVSLLKFHNEVLAARFLRFYWFRLADVFLPVGVALLVTRAIARAREQRRQWSGAWLVLAMLLAGAHLCDVLWQRHDDPRAPANRNLANVADWQAMCRWIAANTPADAVFIVPRDSRTFRWYADRAEVVSHKDMPQDALSVVEWWRRQEIYRADPGSTRAWRSLTELSPQRLKYWGAKYGADYMLSAAWPPLALPRVGPRSNTYTVYRLPHEPKEEARP